MKIVETQIINFNKEYNIIKIYRDDTIEFYLEKIDYGNLFFMVETCQDMKLTDDYINNFIEITKNDSFWEE